MIDALDSRLVSNTYSFKTKNVGLSSVALTDDPIFCPSQELNHSLINAGKNISPSYVATHYEVSKHLEEWQ